MFTSAQIKPSLLRDLSSGSTGTVTLGLIQPNTVYLDRQTQVDLRVSKTVKFQRYRLTGSMDIFNLFNGNNIQSYNARVSATYPTPQDIQPARSAGFNITLNF